jgi:Zn finger protein HypA/HybF involved in hydrogenase expression
MTATVIPFPEKREPTICGEAKCEDCGHIWQAVAPVGTASYECPSCHADAGRLRYVTWRSDDEEHLRCRCGFMGFRVTPTMVYCARCGQEQRKVVLA